MTQKIVKIPDIVTKNTHCLPPILCLLIAYLFVIFITLRESILSGLNFGFGDRADGLIEISILEHWHRFFTGLSPDWQRTAYFYPYPATLGYNDGYFLFGVVYSFWRQWFDPLLSDTLNIVTWKTIGFFATFTLVARVLRWEYQIAVMVAVLFTIANSMALQAVHAQLQLIALLPVAAGLSIKLLKAEIGENRWQAVGWAAALALLLGAWFMTGYYLAWFTMYFSLIFTLTWFATRGPNRVSILMIIVRRHWLTAIMFGLFLIVTLLPFLSTYLPKLGETGGHDYDAALEYFATPLDIANVGPNNFAWGWIFDGLDTGVRGLGHLFGLTIKNKWIAGEHETGFPLLLLSLVLTAAWTVLRGAQNRFSESFRLFALTLVVSWATIINLHQPVVFLPLGYRLRPHPRRNRFESRFAISDLADSARTSSGCRCLESTPQR